MATIDAAGMLARVKTALGISGAWQDELLSGYIAEALDLLRRAGVPEASAMTAEASGLVARIVSDIWSYGPGGVKLSEYTRQRIAQLALSEKGGNSDA